MNFIGDCLDKEQKFNQGKSSSFLRNLAVNLALKWRRAAVAIKNDETIASHTQQVS